MSSSIQLGPFVLKVQGLALIFSVFMSYWVVKYHLKRIEALDSSAKNQIMETLEKGVVLALFVWKFSLFFFHPVQVISNPLSLLYYSGEERGVGLAAVTTLLYIFFRSKKDLINIEIYGELFVSGFLIGSGVYFIFALGELPHRFMIYGTEILLNAFLYSRYFGMKVSEHYESTSGKNLLHALMWYNLGQAFISFFNPLKQNWVWGFSLQQIIYLALALVCIIIDFRRVENKTS
ncbi:hypothetical protein [Desulfitobacterium sp. AusDCA]|uniref:hypothetical protein n=1 Tax=Desulfitobacterium sp. AusDCA TaxID=3240383 RepID=UPI003DA6DB8B